METRTKHSLYTFFPDVFCTAFYSSATKAALKSIRSNAAMIKKVYVPKYLYPLSTVIYNYIIFLISLVVLAIVGVILGVKPTIYPASGTGCPDHHFDPFLRKWNVPCNYRCIFQRY